VDLSIGGAARSGTLIAALLGSCIAAGSDKANAIISADVEQMINNQFVPELQAFDRSLTVTLARCPDTLDFSGGKTVYCTIKVDDTPIQVGIVYAPSTNTASFLKASFYEVRQLNRLEKALLLSGYEVRAEVDCGDPPFRLVPVGTEFTCAVTGSPAVSSLRLKAQADGQVFTFNPPGLSSPAWISAAVDQHKAGKETTLDGAAVEKWIADSAEAEYLAYSGDSQPALTIVVHCPSKMDVTGSKHVQCVVTIDGHDVRHDVSIDDVKGVDDKSLDAVIDQQKVERAAQDDFNTRLKQNSLPANAVVHCGRGILVVTPPGTFYCTATAGGDSYKVEVSVEDAKGTVHWRGIQISGSRPAPSTSPRV
jgi:Domain of unknown function (DUF4333)